MGTGSFSGGGSGALGRASSGASASSGPPRKPKDKKDKTPSSEFFRNNGSSEAPSLESAGAVVRDTFAQRGVGDYMTNVVSSPAVRGCFEELFLVSVLLRQEQKWDTIKDQYGVRDAPGCLADLATTIKRKHIDSRSSEAFREIAGAAVADVLLAAVGEDDDVYLDGRAKDVFASVRKHGDKIFRSLAGYYFGSVLYRAALRELPALDEGQKVALQKATQQRADFLIAKFAHSFLGKTVDEKQTTYRQMLKVFSDNPDWFQENLRREIS
jgi:hypothetical protein